MSSRKRGAARPPNLRSRRFASPNALDLARPHDNVAEPSSEVVHSYLHQNDRLRDSAAEKASLSSKWNLGQAPGASDLSVTTLKHEMEDLLRGDPAMVRQMLALGKSLHGQQQPSQSA